MYFKIESSVSAHLHRLEDSPPPEIGWALAPWTPRTRRWTSGSWSTASPSSLSLHPHLWQEEEPHFPVTDLPSAAAPPPSSSTTRTRRRPKTLTKPETDRRRRIIIRFLRWPDRFRPAGSTLRPSFPILAGSTSTTASCPLSSPVWISKTLWTLETLINIEWHWQPWKHWLTLTSLATLKNFDNLGNIDNTRNIVKIHNFDDFINKITVSNQLKISQLSWSWANLSNLQFANPL